MIEDVVARLAVAEALGNELDGLVRDRMGGLVEEPYGVDVVRATETLKKSWNVLGAASFFEEVLRCTLGDLRRVPSGPFGDRRALKEMLEKIGAGNAVWLNLEKRQAASRGGRRSVPGPAAVPRPGGAIRR